MDQVVASAKTLSLVKYSGFWRRVAATLIDGLIVSLSTSAVSSLSVFVQGETFVLFINIINFAISLGYYTFLIGYRGQTIGKMVMKIKIVRVDGSSVSFGRAALREALGKFVSVLTLFVGHLWMIRDTRKQTFHDKIADTVVVKI